MKNIKKLVNSFVFKTLVFSIAMVWGLSANGYEIMAVPKGLEVLFGDYLTEGLAILIAWTVTDGVSDQINY